MRLIHLSLDQISTNSLLCRLWYDSSLCPSSSSAILRLLLPFLSESVPRIYREREKEQCKKRTEQKMRKSQPNIKKKETQLRERERNEQWNAREKRERKHGFYVIPIEIGFYGKVHPSLVLHKI